MEMGGLARHIIPHISIVYELEAMSAIIVYAGWVAFRRVSVSGLLPIGITCQAAELVPAYINPPGVSTRGIAHTSNDHAGTQSVLIDVNRPPGRPVRGQQLAARVAGTLQGLPPPSAMAVWTRCRWFPLHAASLRQCSHLL